MRLLHLDWPHLPFRLEAARAALPELVVLGGQAWDQGTVLDCSPPAARLGVRPGQPLGAAHKLVPEARFVPADLAAYERSMEAALEALSAFTPSLEGASQPTAPEFGRVLLGIEGLERLWGDERSLARRVVGAVEPLLPGRPRLGIGNTRFGAHIAAVVGARRSHGRAARIPVGDARVEADYLAPLPVSLLPAAADMHERLRVLGLRTIGEFAALSRSSVIARFGPPGGELHDLARGLDSRPLRPRRPLERLRAEAEIEPPVDQIEPLRFVLRHLSVALCAQLEARGAGASTAVLELDLEDQPALRLEQALPEPVAAADLIERLLLARLSADAPSSPVTRLCLELQATAPAAGQQLGLFAPQLARAARLDWHLAGLAIRFGSDRLLRARILDPEAALGEHRVEWQPAAGQPFSPAS